MKFQFCYVCFYVVYATAGNVNSNTDAFMNGYVVTK